MHCQRAVACLLAVVLAVAPASTSGLSFDVQGAKNRPVTKVITLLKDMLEQLEKEAEEDEEIYDKMACWCETNDKEKTKTIADAESHITDLTSSINAGAATSSRLNAEVADLTQEVEEETAALNKAAAIREKEFNEFNTEEREMLEAVSALKAAIVVLSKHHGGGAASASALQKQALLDIGALIKTQLYKHADILGEVITPSQKRAVLSGLLQETDGDVKTNLKKQPAPPSSMTGYTPASGQIFGVLKQMKETFEKNLSESQKQEMRSQQAFEELKAAKEAQIAAAKKQIEKKTQEIAIVDEKLANDKQDIEDTRNSLSADQKFLMNLKQQCQLTDAEWEARQKERQAEMAAVSKALAVLSSDEAHDTFTKTFNSAAAASSLLQVFQENTDKVRRVGAAQLLMVAASRLHSPKLAQLAESAKLDAFTRVKKAIDDMVAELLKEQEDEKKHRDWCIENMNTNEKTSEQQNRKKEDLTEKIADLTATIDTLTTDIATLKSEIAEMQVQIKRAGEDREQANKELQMTVADQRETQKLLQQALDVLQGYYGKGKEALVQQGKERQPAGPAPPPGFKKYEKNAAAGGVVGLITQIIEDAKAMEAEALKGEQEAQKEYETFIQNTNDSIVEKQASIVDKTNDKAKAESEKVDAETAKKETQALIDTLVNEYGDLKTACDFVLKNFDIRQTARGEEIEALRQAKAILSGAKLE